MSTAMSETGNIRLTTAATNALRDLATNGPARDSQAATPRDNNRWINHDAARGLVAKGLAYRMVDGDDIWITPAGCDYLGLDLADMPAGTVHHVEQLLTTLDDVDVDLVHEELDQPDTAPTADPELVQLFAEEDTLERAAHAGTSRMVVDLPIDQVHPAPTNRPARNLDDLTMSIVELGVLEPILVRAVDDGSYEIIAGARRHAASKQAGKPTVPCLIEDRDDQGVEFARLIENIHREELTPLEEADTYQRLANTFGLTGADIARKAGRSEAHVSKRRSLALLPDPAKVALDEGRITISTALGLTGLLKAPAEYLEDLLEDLPTAGDEQWARERFDRALFGSLRDWEAEKTRTAVTEELVKAGETVVDYPRFGRWHTTDYRVCRDNEPHEAYSVDDHGHTIKITTAPLPESARQAPSVPGTPKAPAPKNETDKQRTERQAREAAQQALDDMRADAARRRTATIRALLGRRRAGLHDAATDRALTEYVLNEIVAQVTTDGQDIYCGTNEPAVHTILALDENVTVATYADRTNLTRLRTAAAVLLLGAEDTTTTNERGPNPLPAGEWLNQSGSGRDEFGDVRRYFALLLEHGYEPTPEEHAALTEADPTDEEE